MFMFSKIANFKIHISTHYEYLWASLVVLNMWPYKSIFTSKFFFSSNLAYKTKIGITNKWETTNNNPRRLIKLSS
jgi:hypothetical protein